MFQTSSPYSPRIDLDADVAIVYGFGKTMPDRVKSWREKGYTIHLMTGVAWGEYQDYYYGRWDGVDHQDEAQTRANGEKIGHGGDIYYMSPGANYGKYLASGVRRALDAGVGAVHLEEPEFWVGGGYGEGFKNEWKAYYNEAWQDPASSPDARWHAAKLMYFLYRRALQQVFDSVQDYNKAHGTHVRCYVPTHSLLNYSSWGIVSPESSLARLNGCDGYIAQVWTGTARTPNTYLGVSKERTFETAFLEYGSMQNLVRATGRGVWYLADPVEDNADHDWSDYRQNYHSTLIASLLQPEVSHYEVMPWPERVFNGKYPSPSDKSVRVGIPDAYAQELQIVIRALKDMNQSRVRWDSAKGGIGFVVSDSLMFQRGGPSASDQQMGHVYGLAMPFVKRGIPIQPVQLENDEIPGYLKDLKVLLMTYEGMKPLSPTVHAPIAKWVRDGGTLAFVDDDLDPFLRVREWWNTGSMHYATPREELFEQLGVGHAPSEGVTKVGRGRLIYLKRSPTALAGSSTGGDWLFDQVKSSAGAFPWKPSSSFILERGPYVVAAGMDESTSPVTTLHGNFINLFDHDVDIVHDVLLSPNSRQFLIDLDKFKGTVIAASGKVIEGSATDHSWSGTVEGISDTGGILLLRVPRPPTSTTIDGQKIPASFYSAKDRLLWLGFRNNATPKTIQVSY